MSADPARSAPPPADAPPTGRATERRAQKARTREAILAGARALMAEGAAVSVAAAAARSGISKATAYRYFSDPAVMAAEAGLAVEALPYETVVAGAEDLAQKLEAIAAHFLDLALDHEPAFRQFLARSLDAWDRDATEPRRGGRRVAMVERAIAEDRPDLAPGPRAALARGIAVATGAEAMIALLDVAGASPAAARATVRDLARALAARHLGAEPAP